MLLVIGRIALIVMEKLNWQFFVIINHRIMSLMLRIPKTHPVEAAKALPMESQLDWYNADFMAT